MASNTNKDSSLRAKIAWVFYDWADTAFGTIIQTFIFAAFFTRAIAEDQQSGTLLWGNTIGIAGLIVAFTAPFLGAIADQKGRLKPWLFSGVILCCAATASLWFILPDAEYLHPAMLLVILATIGSQSAMIFYNALLPHLVPSAKQGLWSGWGWGMGYIGGLLCLVIAWFAFLGDQPLLSLNTQHGEHVRATCIFTAAWMGFFSLPLLFFTPDKPTTGKSICTAIRDGMKQLADSIRNARQYRSIIQFLCANMLYKDALAALFAMGGVFAAGTFGMEEKQILLFGITLNLSAGAGAIGFAWVDHHIGSRRTVLLGLVGLMASAVCMLFVAQSITSFWIYGTVMGLFFGPIQASSRSYLSQIAPEHLRTQMFGLYTLSGRATSFLGPMLVGWITVLAHSQRIGMSALLLMFALGFLILLLTPQSKESD